MSTIDPHFLTLNIVISSLYQALFSSLTLPFSSSNMEGGPSKGELYLDIRVEISHSNIFCSRPTTPQCSGSLSQICWFNLGDSVCPLSLALSLYSTLPSLSLRSRNFSVAMKLNSGDIIRWWQETGF